MLAASGCGWRQQSKLNAGKDSYNIANCQSAMKNNIALYKVIRFTLILSLIAIIFTPVVIIKAGERGVVMRFGKVQNQVLGEGLHLVIPIVDTVQNLSVRLQNQEISAEASSKDLQDVFTNVVLNWHIITIGS